MILDYRFDCKISPLRSFKNWSVNEHPTFMFIYDKEVRSRLIRPSLQSVEAEIDELLQEQRLHEPMLKKLKASKSPEDVIGGPSKQPINLDLVLKFSSAHDSKSPSYCDLTEFLFPKNGPAKSHDVCLLEQSSPGKSQSDSGSSRKSRSDSGSSRKSRSDSGSSRPSLFDSDSEESLSLSEMKTEVVGRYLGLDINQLLFREKHNVGDLISVTQNNLDDLIKKVYNAIRPFVQFGRFPHDLVKKTFEFSYMEIIISLVLDHVQTKLGLDKDGLFLERNQRYFVKLNEELKKVRTDFVVRGEKRYLVVVECLGASCSSGIKRCLVHMMCLYNLNNDQKAVYGICYNGTHFNLLKYEPNEKPELIDHFTLLESSRFLFAEMYKSEFEKDWTDNYTSLIRILYSILLEKLER